MQAGSSELDRQQNGAHYFLCTLSKQNISLIFRFVNSTIYEVNAWLKSLNDFGFNPKLQGSWRSDPNMVSDFVWTQFLGRALGAPEGALFICLFVCVVGWLAFVRSFGRWWHLILFLFLLNRFPINNFEFLLLNCCLNVYLNIWTEKVWKNWPNMQYWFEASLF